MRSERCGSGEVVRETQEQPFQLSFHSALRVESQGARVRSNGGFILVREPDERSGLRRTHGPPLARLPPGQEYPLPLANLLRQSIDNRLAVYEDVCDAARLL